MRKIVLGVLLCVFISLAPSICVAKRKEVPLAPLPEVIAEAHRVFITNGGGSQLAFDEFYSQIKDWARFNIVGSPAEADIIMELRFAVEDHGSHVHSAYNSYTKQTSVYTDELVDPQLTLDVYDPATKVLLWSDVDHRRLAGREKNREKETIKSADRIVQQLRERISPPQ